MNEEHEGRRKNELTWKIHRIHWEKNRFIYDLMYVRKVMSRELVCCALRTLAWLEGCLAPRRCVWLLHSGKCTTLVRSTQKCVR